jgi:hypothetical protein
MEVLLMASKKEFWEKLGGIIKKNGACPSCPANPVCSKSRPCWVTLQEMYSELESTYKIDEALYYLQKKAEKS